jgi:hypothetical protein
MTLTELFNPSFFMLLGILLLALSFLIFYFENKAREQNHKINSMFSLVSSITEELNNANMRIHYLIQGNQSGSFQNIHSVSIPPNTYSSENKIEVSDGEEDEDDDDETDNEDDEEDEEDEEDEDDDDEDDDEDEEDDIDDDKTYYQGTSNKEKPVIPTLEELSDLDEDDSMNGLEEQEEEEEKKETRTLTIHNEENGSIPLEEQIKSIHISLDKINESVDYKKLSVQQLKNLVVQKGLAAFEEASRMKKGELHKLLGV